MTTKACDELLRFLNCQDEVNQPPPVPPAFCTLLSPPAATSMTAEPPPAATTRHSAARATGRYHTPHRIPRHRLLPHKFALPTTACNAGHHLKQRHRPLPAQPAPPAAPNRHIALFGHRVLTTFSTRIRMM